MVRIFQGPRAVGVGEAHNFAPPTTDFPISVGGVADFGWPQKHPKRSQTVLVTMI